MSAGISPQNGYMKITTQHQAYNLVQFQERFCYVTRHQPVRHKDISDTLLKLEKYNKRRGRK